MRLPWRNMNIENAYSRWINRKWAANRWKYNAIYSLQDYPITPQTIWKGYDDWWLVVEYKDQLLTKTKTTPAYIHCGWALMKSQFSSFTAGCLIVWLWLCHYLSLASSGSGSVSGWLKNPPKPAPVSSLVTHEMFAQPLPLSFLAGLPVPPGLFWLGLPAFLPIYLCL